MPGKRPKRTRRAVGLRDAFGLPTDRLPKPKAPPAEPADRWRYADGAPGLFAEWVNPHGAGVFVLGRWHRCFAVSVLSRRRMEAGGAPPDAAWRRCEVYPSGGKTDRADAARAGETVYVVDHVGGYSSVRAVDRRGAERVLVDVAAPRWLAAVPATCRRPEPAKEKAAKGKARPRAPRAVADADRIAAAVAAFRDKYEAAAGGRPRPHQYLPPTGRRAGTMRRANPGKRGGQ